MSIETEILKKATEKKSIRTPEKNPLWYKGGVIYELHVRAFQDSDGDGTGDFRGLTSRLDYLRDLGVTVCIRCMARSRISKLFCARRTSAGCASSPNLF
jgi:pullulanase/glycogen debranching enzyme